MTVWQNDEAGGQVWSDDEVAGTDVVTDAELAASGGSALVGFAPSGTGAITGTVAGQLQKFCFTGDYSTSGQFVTAASALTESAGFFKVRVSNGTAAAPSVCGINFIDTGFYFATGKILGSLSGIRAFELTANSVYLGAGGIGAGGFITTGVQNVMLGEAAGRLITDGSNNVIIGWRAALDTDSPGIHSNVIIGSTAGQNLETGNGVTSGGFQEVIVGHLAGLALTTGCNNTFVGHSCGSGTTTGGSNAMYGRGSGVHNTTGGFNAYIGHAAGFKHTTGSGNTMIGDEAGHPDISGDPDKTGSNNVAIGQECGTTLAAGSNTICIGNDAIVQASNTAKLGLGLTDTTVSGLLHSTQDVASVASATGVTYSTDEFHSSVILRTGAAGGGFNDTTPSAAAIVAAIPGCEVGTGYDLYIRNVTGQTMTMLAGSGITLAGTTTVANSQSRLYKVYATNVTASSEAVTVLGVFTAAV